MKARTWTQPDSAIHVISYLPSEKKELWTNFPFKLPNNSVAAPSAQDIQSNVLLSFLYKKADKSCTTQSPSSHPQRRLTISLHLWIFSDVQHYEMLTVNSKKCDDSNRASAGGCILMPSYPFGNVVTLWFCVLKVNTLVLSLTFFKDLHCVFSHRQTPSQSWTPLSSVENPRSPSSCKNQACSNRGWLDHSAIWISINMDRSFFIIAYSGRDVWPNSVRFH